VELRHLRAFLAVAQERHFRRAAARLGMSQPPLSMLIQALEKEVGVLLLRRNRRSVELTEAGAHFLAEAQAVLDKAQRAIIVARDVGQGKAGRLDIGFTGSCAFNPVLWQLFRAFREDNPQVDLVLTEQNTMMLFGAVREGALDVASFGLHWMKT
jgi:DNA-binding transcriptional LysR family regulator